jgi:hypothetical protein
MVRDFPQQQGETQPRESMKSLAYVAAIVISMVTLLIAVISNARGSLDPFVFNLVVAGFGAAILALLGFYFVVQPLRPRVDKWRQESREESAAADILPKLADLVNGFFELASRDRTTGIHQAMRSFSEQPDPRQTMTVPEAYPREKYLMQELASSYDTVIHTPFTQLQSDIRRSFGRPSRKQLLVHFAAEFSHLLSIYKRLFVDSYFEACRRVGVDSVPDRSREEYGMFLTKYTQFGASFVEFARDTNRRMGMRVLADYFEDGRPLKA